MDEKTIAAAKADQRLRAAFSGKRVPLFSLVAALACALMAAGAAFGELKDGYVHEYTPTPKCVDYSYCHKIDKVASHDVRFVCVRDKR